MTCDIDINRPVSPIVPFKLSAPYSSRKNRILNPKLCLFLAYMVISFLVQVCIIKAKSLNIDFLRRQVNFCFFRDSTSLEDLLLYYTLTPIFLQSLGQAFCTSRCASPEAVHHLPAGLPVKAGLLEKIIQAPAWVVSCPAASIIRYSRFQRRTWRSRYRCFWVAS